VVFLRTFHKCCRYSRKYGLIQLTFVLLPIYYSLWYNRLILHMLSYITYCRLCYISLLDCHVTWECLNLLGQAEYVSLLFLACRLGALCPRNLVLCWARPRNCEEWLLSSCLVACLSVYLCSSNNWAPTVRIFVKLYIWGFFENFLQSVSLKSDTNNGYFMCRRFYVYNNIWLSVIGHQLNVW
jgi:hypothetical protein